MIERIAGRYGLPLNVMTIQAPETGVQETAEPLVRRVEKVSRSVPPRDAAVPREEWMQYAELRQQIKMLQVKNDRS